MDKLKLDELKDIFAQVKLMKVTMHPKLDAGCEVYTYWDTQLRGDGSSYKEMWGEDDDGFFLNAHLLFWFTKLMAFLYGRIRVYNRGDYEYFVELGARTILIKI